MSKQPICYGELLTPRFQREQIDQKAVAPTLQRGYAAPGGFVGNAFGELAP